MAYIIAFEGKVPKVAEGVFLAPRAVLLGDVVVEEGASIWFGAVLRADFGRIVVGRGTSVQDNVVILTGRRVYHRRQRHRRAPRPAGGLYRRGAGSHRCRCSGA